MRADERRDPSATEPFFLPGGSVGCLLVHGFAGSPYDMRFLGERLHAAGHTASALRLSDHADRLAELGADGWREWQRGVEQALEELRRHCRTVVAIGLSLGGLLVLRLAAERPAMVQALVLLSPALILANPWPARLAGVASLVLPLLPPRLRFVNKAGSDIADPQTRASRPSYARMPLRSVFEIVRLQEDVRAALPHVTQPVLLLQGRHDGTVSLETVDFLQRGLANLQDAIVLPDSRHVITVDVERDRVASEVVNFVGRAASGPACG